MGKRDGRTTVEDGLILDIFHFHRWGVFKGRWSSGNVNWKSGDEVASRIGYTFTADTQITLSYRVKRMWDESGQDIKLPVSLMKTPCHFGKYRYWFLCPLVINGRACLRRVGKLYLPPGGLYFGCRSCYNLTYQSCQEHDPRSSWVRRSPGSLRKLLQSNRVSDCILALKSVGKL